MAFTLQVLCIYLDEMEFSCLDEIRAFAYGRYLRQSSIALYVGEFSSARRS